MPQQHERPVPVEQTGEHRTYRLWIDGADVPAAGGGTFEVENPANKQIIARVAEGRAEDVDRAVDAARRASRVWGTTPPTERFHCLCRLAGLIKAHSAALARWETLAGAAFAAFIAAGQTCVQGARLIVHRRVYAAFGDELARRAERIRMGDPLDPDTQMGPVSSCKQYERVLSYIKAGVDEGARLLTGGQALLQPPFDRGYHIAPTIFADVRPDMTIARDEIFGPVTTMIPFGSEEEAIAIANDSRFGLGAAVWTRDVGRAHRVAHALESGVVWINDHHRIDPAMPWGGFKDSSTGREAGLQAYRAYTQSQTIVVRLTDEPFDWYAGGGRYS